MACAVSPSEVSLDLLDQAWALSSSVALRPEPFGALAYDFDTRRLTFLKRPELLTLVNGLGDFLNVRAALLHHHIDAQHWPAYERALSELANTGMLVRQPAPEV